MDAIAFRHYERALALSREVVREQILCLRESERLDEGGIVAWIPGGHDHGVLLEAADEHAAFVIRGRVHRPAHGVEIARTKPCFRGAEKRGGDFLVFDTLKESEEADAVVVKRVVCTILDRGDSADRPAVSECEKELSICSAVERIAFDVQRIAHGDAQRRHPLRVRSVPGYRSSKGDLYDPTHIAPRLD